MLPHSQAEVFPSNRVAPQHPIITIISVGGFSSTEVFRWRPLSAIEMNKSEPCFALVGFPVLWFQSSGWPHSTP